MRHHERSVVAPVARVARSRGPAGRSPAAVGGAVPSLGCPGAILCRAVSALCCRSHGVASTFRARLAENDFEMLRALPGDISLTTYLAVALDRIAAERRDQLWERWREEASAAGHGDAVAALEKLVYDEALTSEEALATIRAADDPQRQAPLAALWDRRPWGTARPVTDLKWLPLRGQLDAPAKSAEASSALSRELTELELQLVLALRNFEPDERFLLRVHFADRLPIKAIARWQQRPSAEVAKRIEVLVGRLRELLAESGVEVADVGALLADPRPGYRRKLE